MLITSGEHYGAVLNQDFDYRKYLDALAADKLNLTRTFTGAYVEPRAAFNIAKNTLAPAAGRFLAPWARSDQPGYAGGGNKFDLERWDDAYFARLKDFVAHASKNGVVVELNLFCPMYEELQWKVSPLNPANNVQEVGPSDRTHVYTLDKSHGLLAVQEELVRKIVAELAEFDNVYYEICNEPYFGGVTLEWQDHIADIISAAEHDLPHPHLISRNVANNTAKVTNPHPELSIFNFHYADPPDAVAENYGLGAIGDNETGFAGTGDATYRMEGWDFILAGGGLYNNLDYSFVVGHEDGTFEVPHATRGGGATPAASARHPAPVHRRLRSRAAPARAGARDRRRPGGRLGAGAGGSGRAYGVYLRRQTTAAAFSARWSGVLMPPASGTYQTPRHLERRRRACRIGRPRRSTRTGPPTRTKTEHGRRRPREPLTAGRSAMGSRCDVEYFYGGGTGVMRLAWTRPDGVRETDSGPTRLATGRGRPVAGLAGGLPPRGSTLADAVVRERRRARRSTTTAARAGRAAGPTPSRRRGRFDISPRARDVGGGVAQSGHRRIGARREPSGIPAGRPA